MKIMCDADVPRSLQTRTYREFAWDHLVAGLLMAALALAALAAPLAYEALRAPWAIGLSVAFAAGIGLLARFALNAFRASRRPECWLAAWTPQGLYLRFRSYHNYRFPSDTPSVVFLDRREVAWIRTRARKLQLRDNDGGWTTRRTARSLEVALDDVDPGALTVALREEARRRVRGARANHYPVTLTGDGTVLVEMRRPDALLAQLAPYFPVRDAEAIAQAPFERMSRREREDYIVTLVRAGETVDAVAAAREVYQCSLAEAKKLVQDLSEC